MQTLRVWQGLQRDYQSLQIANNDGTPAIGVFTSGAVLSASVWEGGNQTTILTPTVAWNTTGGQTGYGQGQFSLSISGTQSAPLDPAGEYHVLVSSTTAGVTSPAWEGMLKVLATPGSVSPSPPDLITYDYCLGQLRRISLTDDQIDVIPLLIPAASQLWRLLCGEINFDQRTLTEEHEVENDGYVRLLQQPVQVVTRVQGIPNQALTVSNTSSSVQTAQAYFSYAVSASGTSTITKTATGLVLNWVSNGVPSTTTLLFATYTTISALATAINAVGSGWSAMANYGQWGSTELTGGSVAQGCSSQNPNPLGSGAAIFNVLGDIGCGQLRPRSPMLFVGRQQGGNALAERWGHGGYELFDSDGQEDMGLVKVTYISGFPVIPPDVQNQVAQIVKWKLELGVQELLLKMENADDYQYEMSPEMAHAVPTPIKEAAGQWKQTFA